MLAEISQLIGDVDDSFTTYRFHDAMNRLYDTTWHSYCDWYVEMAKGRLRDDVDAASRNAAAWTALTSLDVILRLLHPFMPFLTEECAQHLPDAAVTLQQRDWPSAPSSWADDDALRAHEEVEWLIDLAKRIRALRQERTSGGERARIAIALSGETRALAVERAAALLSELLKAEIVESHNGANADVVPAGGLLARVVIAAAGGGDRAHERKRLDQLDTVIARSRAQLSDERFVTQAPQAVVDGVRRRLSEAEAEATTLRQGLEEAS